MFNNICVKVLSIIWNRYLKYVSTFNSRLWSWTNSWKRFYDVFRWLLSVKSANLVLLYFCLLAKYGSEEGGRFCTFDEEIIRPHNLYFSKIWCFIVFKIFKTKYSCFLFNPRKLPFQVVEMTGFIEKKKLKIIHRNSFQIHSLLTFFKSTFRFEHRF